MKSALSGKVIAAIAGGVSVVAIVVVALVLLFSDKSYRTIKIYDMVGTAKVGRNGDNLDAVVNMTLKSGDRVRIDNGSTMYIKMDEDKYLMGESGTIFSLEATGSSADSKTKINLEYGTLSNDIRSSLSKDSVYEVETPNAVMAVRGTFFIAEYYKDENGEYVTRITVHEGKVETWVKNAAGVLSEESVIVVAGQQEEIRTFRSVEELQQADAESSEVIVVVLNERAIFEPHSFLYDDETREELEFFYESIKNGTVPVGTTRAYIEYLLFGGEEPEPTPTPSAEPGKTTEPGETTEPVATDSPEVTSEPAPEQSPSPTVAPTATAVATTPTASPAATAEASATATPTPTVAPTPTPTPIPEGSYQVTFVTASGSTFATQVVEGGKTASAPKLQPTATGTWDFDFSTPIEETTTITWKEVE